MTRAVELAQVASTGVSEAFKNRIINGAMVIDQRNGGASVTASVINASVYMIDRWRYYSNTGGSKFSYQQNAGSVTPPPGFLNYFGITSLTANSPAATDEYIIQQSIEGFNIYDFDWGTANAKTVTLSFWARSSLTGNNFGACVKSANAGYTYPFNFSIPTANTWTFITVTIPGPTLGLFGSTNGVGLQLLFNLGTGSTYLAGTSGAWTTTFSNAPTGSLNILGTNGATFYITGVQLEVGSSATSFEYLDYGNVLRQCQRYYYVLASQGGSNKTLGTGFYANASRVDLTVTYKTSMRAVPTLVQVTGAGYYNIYANNAVDAFNGFSGSGELSTEGAGLYTLSDVSGTSGFAGAVYTANTSAYIAFQAEL